MGHVLFMCMHAAAVLFLGPMLLILTVPLHLIYAVLAGRAAPAAVDPERPTPETHVRCPDCRELVRKDALKCKHCGATLVPQPEPAAAAAAPREAYKPNAQRGYVYMAIIAAAVVFGLYAALKH